MSPSHHLLRCACALLPVVLTLAATIVSFGPALEQNTPNPFAGSTTVSCTLSKPGNVSLRPFDLLGREVARVVDGPMPAGRSEVVLDVTGLADGAYLLMLTSANGIETRTIQVRHEAR